MSASGRHVIFRARGQAFALPLESVREVVPAPAGFTLVPRAPTALRGVMNLRGRVVTALDFGALLALELPPQRPDPSVARLLLLEGGKRDVGLLVDEVVGIRELPHEPPLPGAPPEVTALSRLDGAAVTVLAAEALLATARTRLGKAASA